MRLIVPRSTIITKKVRSRRPAPLLYPTSIEALYSMSLTQLVNCFIEDYSTVIEKLPSIYSSYPLKTDDWYSDLSQYVKAVEDSIYKRIGAFKETVSSIADKTMQWNSKQWKKHISSIFGNSILLNQTHKKELKEVFVAKELDKIRALVPESTAQVQEISAKAIRNKQLKPLIDLKAIHLKVRRAASISIASFGMELYKDEHLSMGIEEYIWRTMRDERVRQSHQPLDGKICSWNDSTVFKYIRESSWISKAVIGGVMLHVGEDYNCRCYPEADFTQLL